MTKKIDVNDNAVDGNEKFTILGDELEYIYSSI